MSTFSITVNIADRPYKLKIDMEEEEVIRKAVKSINEKMKAYAESYAYKDKQDLLAMVALQFSTYAVKYESKAKSLDNETIDKLNQIDNLLTNCLNQAENVL